MSDNLNKYPGNLKHHRVDAPAMREPLLSDDEIERYSMMYTIPSRYETARALKHAKAIYETARAKDGEEIAKWKGIVKGVHGALNDIGTVPVPPLDADLYDAVMAIRAKDAELIQRLANDVVRLQATYANDTGRETFIGNEALKAAIAQGFKL